MKCGRCCVSPSCTLSEFLYLFDYLHRNLPVETIETYLCLPLELHPEYEGNVRCMFLKDTQCSIHKARTGGCRLFGIPSLKELHISELEECKNSIKVSSGRGDIVFITQWLQQLIEIDARLYSFGVEPYYIKGFSIHCWLDIYFDDSLDFDVFDKIRVIMKQYIDLSAIKKSYTFKTNLREKIDKITILSSLLGSNDRDTIEQLLLSIRDDYPETGTYFYEEAIQFLNVSQETAQ